VLIWQGAAEMVGSDPGRAVVGYGPESMYVAFTPFYPPELAHYEARNRSPDRAHNEMWDALITTGALGLAAYLAVFCSVLFVGVRALGLMDSSGRVRFFVLSLSVGAALGTAAALVVDRSWRFVGVGMPLGILGGLGVYAAALAFRRAEPATASSEPAGAERRDLILVAALLAGVIAHFLEIHLGIAIAATRTYFWVWAAVLTVLAEGWMEPESLPAADRPAATPVRTPPRKRSPRRPAPAARKPWFERLVSHPVAPLSLVTGLILVMMAWDFTTNPQGLNDPVAVIAQSITRVTTAEGVRTRSAGLLWLFLATFLSGGVLAVAGSVPPPWSGPSASWWARAAGVVLALSGGLGLAYSVLHARLLTGLRDPSVLPNDIAAALGVIGLALVGSLWKGTRRAPEVGHAAVPIVGAVALVCILFFADARNLQVVRADIVHKEGTKYDAQQDWATAAALYERAHLMQPEEDFYLLYWGRALLEVAADETDPAAQDTAYAKALSALEQARRLNPLNTDHSTNIARLYRRWAYDTTDEATARSRRLLAVEAYAQAAALSPHNASILNEWALTYQDLGDLDAAETKYRESLALDPEYGQTYLLLGELYQARGDWQRARENYARAAELDPTSLQAWADLGGANASLGDWDAAIAAFRRGLDVNANVPRLWGYLGDAYSRTGDVAAAVDAYQHAVALDGGFVEAWRALADHLIRLQRWDEAKAAVERLRELGPDDYTSLRMLAQVAAQEGRLDEGLAYLRQALSLAPAEERAVLEAYIAEMETAAGKDGTQP